jgi:dipeptidyl-peptidase-3
MKKTIFTLCLAIAIASCGDGNKKSDDSSKAKVEYPAKVVYKLYDDPNRFADIELLRYDVNGFENLTLKQKKLVYYLSQAALCGRDMIYDQNNRNNLRLRKTFEELYTNYKGDKSSEEFKRFEVYLKRFWMSNGIHHHYAENKILPEFSSAFLKNMLANSPDAKLPFITKNDSSGFQQWLVDIVFNPEKESKRVNKSEGVDPIAASANNFYEGLTQKEVDQFYQEIKNSDTIEPISWGLNSKLINKDGQLVEKVWKVGGMYGEAISKMVEWLEKAITVAENKEQADALKLLVEFYKTGDLKIWDAYNIAWVKDVNSSIDVINGFIEVYHDPIGMRANYESAVEINDQDASQRMSIIAKNAQWFEDNSPIEDKFKKSKVVGITYKVVNVAMEAGDLSPSTAIGINLPNSEWIREKHGSKSVSLGNIVDAYNKANSGGMLKEFCWSEEQVARGEKYGQLASKMHTALHEVIGHASGQLNPGVTKSNLGQYGSTLEEARADLVALYFLMDKKLVDIGVMPSLEVGMAEYDGYIRNGLMVQLRRLVPGENIEEDHMRNRQMIAKWVFEKGKSENTIEKKVKDGKTYFVINDYTKLRQLFGELLKNIQHIKSTGDFEAGKQLVENYGVKVDKNIHTEVLKRTKVLDIAAYSGFIQPKMTAVMENGEITDVVLDFTESFIDQMMRYSSEYNFLPYEN